MKKKLLLFVFIWMAFFGTCQNADSTALILIDIQNFYFPGGKAELVEPENAAQNAKKVLEHFRKNKALVVHVRHNFEPGGEIHELVKPISEEKVFTKNEVNCFLGTSLDSFLKDNQIKNVVLAGMQTHMCLEAGTRAAHDLGFNCTVIADACATRNLKFGETQIPAPLVHASTLSTLQSYAKVINCYDFLNEDK